MRYAKTLARLRREKGYTQTDVANFITQQSAKTYTFKNISHWETGVSQPPIEQFLQLCALYGVQDIPGVFCGMGTEFRGLAKLNALGRNRAEEHIALLSGHPLFAEPEGGYPVDTAPQRLIKLYDAPVAAGAGAFLDNGSFEYLALDKTIPAEADYAVKVSGDSMTPRFVDGQIVFAKEQQTLELGDIGIFALDGDAYIKKLGQGELISLNAQYEPIAIREYHAFHIFGKVVG